MKSDGMRGESLTCFLYGISPEYCLPVLEEALGIRVPELCCTWRCAASALQSVD